MNNSTSSDGVSGSTDSIATTAPERHALRVLAADDDPFTLSLVADGLRLQGYDVETADHTDVAWTKLGEWDPHVLISDLDFGAGESGAALLRRAQEEYPWVALVVLTSHLAPELAVGDSEQLPRGIVYVVKSQVKSVSDLNDAVQRALSGRTEARPEEVSGDTIWLTPAQAEILRMLATGASTRAIADHRGTTVRAVETLLKRLYVALDLVGDDDSNPRIAAVRLWQQGRVSVR